ncbi:MAG: hypothetical protein JO108_04920 [Acidobacteriaceae bacterium]|nr:hypothetical protein [Acidobacteriaceae bacterium]
MVFNGFYTYWHWWAGSISQTQQINFPAPVNVYAFGSLGAVMASQGQGCAYVGITEYTYVDAQSGVKVTKNTMQGEFPVPMLEAQEVTSITFLFGSKTPYVNTIEYANASLNVLLWS